MFRFANPQYFYLLIIVLLILVLFVYSEYSRKKRLDRFGKNRVIEKLMPSVSKYRPQFKFSLQLLVIILLVFTLARPQMGSKVETVKKEGVEIEVVLDVSNSMNAKDISPTRLEKAKMLLSKLVDDLDNDKVGLIVFAGDAYTQIPITSDFVSAKMVMTSINTGIVPSQGTAIGRALDLASTSFTQDVNTEKAIILITDAENHEDDAIAAAKKAQELGIRVFVIGIGKPEGSPIPKPGTNDYFKDRSGQVVVSRLNEEMCQEIAGAGKGLYVRCDNTNTAMRALQQELDRIATTELETTIYADYNEQYQSFVLLALLTLLIDFFIMMRQNHKLNRMDLFKESEKILTK